MKIKHTLLLTLVCATLAPLALDAAPQKKAVKAVAKQPIIEYCVYSRKGQEGKIEYPDGTATTLSTPNAAVALTQLARSGWRVVASGTTAGPSNLTNTRYWTLERRR